MDGRAKRNYMFNYTITGQIACLYEDINDEQMMIGIIVLYLVVMSYSYNATTLGLNIGRKLTICLYFVTILYCIEYFYMMSMCVYVRNVDMQIQSLYIYGFEA